MIQAAEKRASRCSAPDFFENLVSGIGQSSPQTCRSPEIFSGEVARGARVPRFDSRERCIEVSLCNGKSVSPHDRQKWGNVTHAASRLAGIPERLSEVDGPGNATLVFCKQEGQISVTRGFTR